MLIKLYLYKKTVYFNFNIKDLSTIVWYFKIKINYLTVNAKRFNNSTHTANNSIFNINCKKNIFYKYIKILSSNSFFIKKNYFFFINFFSLKNFNFFYLIYSLGLFHYFRFFFNFFLKKNKINIINLKLI